MFSTFRRRRKSKTGGPRPRSISYDFLCQISRGTRQHSFLPDCQLCSLPKRHPQIAPSGVGPSKSESCLRQILRSPGSSATCIAKCSLSTASNPAERMCQTTLPWHAFWRFPAWGEDGPCVGADLVSLKRAQAMGQNTLFRGQRLWKVRCACASLLQPLCKPYATFLYVW